MRLSILLSAPLAAAMFIPTAKDDEAKAPERVESLPTKHRPFGTLVHQKVFENRPESAPGKLLSDKPPFSREQTTLENENVSEEDSSISKAEHHKGSFWETLKGVASTVGEVTQKQRQAMYGMIKGVADRGIFDHFSTDSFNHTGPVHFSEVSKPIAAGVKNVEGINEPIKEAFEPISGLTVEDYDNLSTVGWAQKENTQDAEFEGNFNE